MTIVGLVIKLFRCRACKTTTSFFTALSKGKGKKFVALLSVCCSLSLCLSPGVCCRDGGEGVSEGEGQ